MYERPDIQKSIPLMMLTENAIGRLMFSVVSAISLEEQIQRMCDLQTRHVLLIEKLRARATEK